MSVAIATDLSSRSDQAAAAMTSIAVPAVALKPGLETPDGLAGPKNFRTPADETS